MFNTILSQLLTWSLKIKNQTEDFGNTETLVGGLLEQIVILVGRIADQMANVAVGVLLKGSKTNESEIKSVASPKRGDTWKAVDTGRYWVFDGINWNDIGIVIPSDVALHGGSALTMQQMDDKKADRILATEISNGLMSIEQVKLLNQLKEQMGTALISDRYDSSVFVRFNNVGPVTLQRGFNIQLTSPNMHIDSNGFVYELAKLSTGLIEIPVTLLEENGYAKVYYDGEGYVTLGNVKTYVDSVQVVSSKVGIVQIDGSTIRQADLSGCPNLWEINAWGTNNVSFYNFMFNKKISRVYCNDNSKLQGIRIHGATETTIAVYNCPLLTNVIIGVSMPSLVNLYISRTSIAKTELLTIEKYWTSRVGKEAGVIVLNEALFNELTTAEKALFINKNITFSIE